MSEATGVRKRVVARDALAARTRKLTGGALTVSALLSGVFAGMAAASAPGHKLVPGTTSRSEPKGSQTAASAPTSTAIPPLPPPPGPGNVSAAPPPAAAPAPTASQAPPVVVSGGS